MPETWIFTIIGSVIVALIIALVVSATKIAGLEHSLKLRDDQITGLRKQLDSSQEEKDKLGIQTGKTNPLLEKPIIEPVANVTNLDEHNAPKSKPPTQYIGGCPRWGKVE